MTNTWTNYNKQYVVITNAKNIQQMSTNLQTIVTHIQHMQQTHKTNDTHQNKSKNNMLYKQMQKAFNKCEKSSNNSKTYTKM